MFQVIVSEFKSKLSQHLRSVRQGPSLVVTNRGIPMAKVIPFKDDKPRHRIISAEFSDPKGLKNIPRIKARKKLFP